MTGELTSSDTERLPWAIVGALLVAMAAHWFTVEGFLGLPLCAAALLLSQLTGARLPATRGLSWSLRAIVVTFIIIVIGMPRESVAQWYVKPEYTNLIGCLLSAEAAIRSWERREPRRGRETRGVMLLLSILIFATATNTGVRTHIHRLAPLFAVLVVLSARSFHPVRQPRTALVILRGAGMLAALGIGLFVAQSITVYDMKITSWAIDLMGNRRSRASEIGLSGSPRLQAVFNPKQSMDRVLLIDGPRGERHLRTLAFDTLENRQWKRALRERDFRQVDPEVLRPAVNGQRVTFTRVGETLDLLAIPTNTAGLEAAHLVEADDTGGLRDQDTGLVGAASRYSVITSKDQYFQGPSLRPPDDGQRERALRLPDELDPRVIELARRVAGQGDPMSRLMRLAMHLRANHAYSLRYDPGGNDPLSDFILNRRAAHCQYFASALVVMSRAIGVPSRFVCGFYAHEHYGPDRMVVRQRDAHAWAECWIDGAGWITLDATPASGLPDQMFDQASSLRRAWEWLSDLPGRLRDWLAQFSTQTLVIGIAVAASVLPALTVVRAILTRRRRGFGPTDYARASDEICALARRFEAWMRRGGVSLASNKTWREQLPPANPACIEFIDLYDQARFGHAGHDLARARELLDQLEHHHGPSQ
jgi:transglutaminase-like putative cysteine protease